jgi:hypothetical protein
MTFVAALKPVIGNHSYFHDIWRYNVVVECWHAIEVIGMATEIRSWSQEVVRSVVPIETVDTHVAVD